MARAQELEAVDQRLSQEERAVAAELSEIVATSHEAHSQIERAKALRSKRSWSSMLELIADTMPPGCWLTELATDPPAPTGVQKQPRELNVADAAKTAQTVTIEAPQKLRIIGYASDPAEPLTFIDNLKASNVFTDVVSKGTQREPAGDGYSFRFELECLW